MFSDTFKMKLVDEVIYEVYGKLTSRTQGDVQIEGFNPSAEEADEGTDVNVESGVDVILNHRLSETFFSDKKAYTVYLKDYMKKYVLTCIQSAEFLTIKCYMLLFQISSKIGRNRTRPS